MIKHTEKRLVPLSIPPTDQSVERPRFVFLELAVGNCIILFAAVAGKVADRFHVIRKAFDVIGNRLRTAMVASAHFIDSGTREDR